MIKGLVTLFYVYYMIGQSQCPIPPILPDPEAISVNVYSNPGETEFVISAAYLSPDFILNPGVEYCFANWFVLESSLLFNVNSPHDPVLEFEPAFTLWSDTCKGYLLGGAINIAFPLQNPFTIDVEPVIGFAFCFVPSFFLLSELSLEITGIVQSAEVEFSFSLGPYYQGKNMYAGLPLRYQSESPVSWGLEGGYDVSDDLTAEVLFTVPFKFDPHKITVFAGIKLEVLGGKSD